MDRLLKWAVKFLQQVLSQNKFDKLLYMLFPIYKQISRFIYLANRIVFGWITDRGNLRMAKRIYSVWPYSLVGANGLEASYKAVISVCELGIHGQIVELGVAKGGCALLMAYALTDGEYRTKIPGTKLWLFDSFEGLPEPTEDDYLEKDGMETGNHIRPLVKGSCLGTLEEVQRLFVEKSPINLDDIVYVKGWFQDTIPQIHSKLSDISVLRIDGDWYESTKCCLEGLYWSVVPGGYIIIDDYLSCFGCKKAVDEFLLTYGLNPEIKLDGRGGCYFLKEK